MRIKFYIFFIVWLITSLARATPIDVKTAQQYAMAIFAPNISLSGKHRVVASKQMELLHVLRPDPKEEPLLYVFGIENGEGYTVIAGDDVAISPILGYSMDGTFNIDSIPCCLREWLDEYGRQIAYARKSPSLINASLHKIERKSIPPLIKSQWGQGAPYNNLCPMDPITGKRCVTGCMATAMAQIMHNHKLRFINEK